MDSPLGSPLHGCPSGPLYLHCIPHCHCLLRAPTEAHCHVGSCHHNLVLSNHPGSKNHGPGIFHRTRRPRLRDGVHESSHFPTPTQHHAGRSTPARNYYCTSQCSCRGRGDRNRLRGRTGTNQGQDLQKNGNKIGICQSNNQQLTTVQFIDKIHTAKRTKALGTTKIYTHIAQHAALRTQGTKNIAHLSTCLLTGLYWLCEVPESPGSLLVSIDNHHFDPVGTDEGLGEAECCEGSTRISIRSFHYCWGCCSQNWLPGQKQHPDGCFVPLVSWTMRFLAWICLQKHCWFG